MKIQKSNNPLAVGALLCVLALIVGRTVWLVTRGDGSAQMVSVVQTTPATATVTAGATTPHMAASAAPAPSAALVPAVPRSARNPFAVQRAASPTPAKSAAAPKASAPLKGQSVDGADITEVRPLPPLPVGALPVVRAVSKPGGPTARTAALSPSAPAPDPLLNVRLTAVVDGAGRMAVLQTTDPQPVIVHEGDTVLGLHVAAIHDREIVFTEGGKTWTLPLQTADTDVSATTNTEAATPAAQETVDAPQ